MIPPTRSAPRGVLPIRTTWHPSEFSSVVVAAAPGNKWCTTMSFPSNDNPYAQYHPASPVPSYQCSASSQSSASSFGVNSPLSTVSSSSRASSSYLGASLLTMPIRPGGSTSSSSATTSTTTMNDSNTVDSFKTHIDSARERFSNGRALLLLEKFAGDNGNASSNITSLKSDLDHCRERGANVRALALLNETSEAIKREDPPAGVVRARLLSAQHVSAVPPEELAESTRKPRSLTEDHVETVAGMKEIHHLEREEWAKKRALWLMSFSSIA
jgi:hypothetical protein